MNHEYPLSLESFAQLHEDDQINHIGHLFDTGYDTKDRKAIEYGFSLATQIIDIPLSPSNLTTLHYNLSNGWSYLRKLKYDQTDDSWGFQIEELTKEIFHLRKAIALPGFAEITRERQCQIFTNLANSFSFIGRFVEAVDYWNRAIAILPNFAMAIGNKGYGLFFTLVKHYLIRYIKIFSLYFLIII
jgi:tetratricopeptide (TPR) repeat protein